MTQKTPDGRMIIGPINDDRLQTGMRRIRSGSIQKFGERIVRGGKLIQECDFSITPPARHFSAEEINGIWIWVNDCARCNQIGAKWSYVSCDDHDRCQCCDIRRNEVNGTVWGHVDATGFCGWICDTCRKHEEEAIRVAALARIPVDEDYDEMDFWHEDEAKCPWCSAKIYTEESYDAEGKEDTCSECGHTFTLTAEHSVTWTTKRKNGSV